MKTGQPTDHLALLGASIARAKADERTAGSLRTTKANLMALNVFRKGGVTETPIFRTGRSTERALRG